MSSKIFVVLAVLVLVMSSVSMAAVAPGYGYLPSSGGGDKDYPLEIEFESTCDGNVVTIYRKNTPETVSGAHVTVTDVTGAPIFSGDTDGDGQITFEGCGNSVVIFASRAGYISDEETHDMIPCEQCEEKPPETPPAPPPTQPTAPTGDEGPEFECTGDGDCLGTEYCKIETGAAGGDCEPVVGECGYAENHAWVAYECGDEAGCPTCDTGFECSDHECVEVQQQETPPAAPPAGTGTEGGTGEGEDGEGDSGWLLILAGIFGILIIGGVAYWLLTGTGGGRR